jgi:hypothetical protein
MSAVKVNSLWMSVVIATFGAFRVVAAAECLEFLQEADTGSDDFVPAYNQDPVCGRALKAINERLGRCDAPQTVCPILDGHRHGLEFPMWKDIPLFDRNGRELSASFALLESLVRARVGYPGIPSTELLQRQDKEVTELMSNIKRANATKQPYFFSKATITIPPATAQSNSAKEIVYQLTRRRCGTSLEGVSRVGLTPRAEPHLFMNHDLEYPVGAPSDNSTSTWPLTGPAKQVILFQGKPYVLTDESTVFHLSAIAMRRRTDGGTTVDVPSERHSCILTYKSTSSDTKNGAARP